ncbi:hypothetical protein N5923_13880 [Erwiniaceae bacterium BAC15a-03b]|uniref:Uncharacterized protein n=1 Tax=Winslowiella arboricola TaxID=2978220 RepID=A0A9J6PQD6_9GAMM|nr:hypothetical protein [Winslowiella arboricola]MCU5772085.1 hypothetical protein [Winslowiella arboricola]MCU5778579.1 hypothetical protein [Winslowiella arboricola]
MAYSNRQIITSLEADRYIALRLKRALGGVGEQMVKQGNMIADAFTRLTWYISCLTDNYQDVCQNLKNEDKRFVLGISELIKRREIIYDLIHIYVETWLTGLSEDEVRKIESQMIKMGAIFSSNYLTHSTIVSGITLVIFNSFSITPILSRERLKRYAKGGVFALSVYGLVDKAAKKAEELRYFNSIYYHALYSLNLEMLYFLVEPVIARNNYFSQFMRTDKELAEGLMRLIL